jgi:hypothetical protein
MGKKRRRGLWLLIVAALVAAPLAIPPLRAAALQTLGRTLVAADPVAAVDVIVISVDSGAAGVLEAADLVRDGVATRVAVFPEPPAPADLEFQRRGVPQDDEAARAIQQLAVLGVPGAMRIPTPVSGTQDEAAVLPGWLNQHQFHSALMVTTVDHSRRTRRVLRRALSGSPLRLSVRPSRYSAFDPETWWQSRSGLRTGIIEIQKLLLDVARHPAS